MLGEVTRLSADYDVLMLQETGDYTSALARVPGFDLMFPPGKGGSETCILVREGLGAVRLPDEQVTTTGWFTVRGGKTPPKWTPVVSVAGIEFRSIHMPPTIQSKAMHLASPRRWKAAQELAASLSPGRVSVTAGDWNLTPGSALVVDTAKRLGLTVEAPVAGTHGKRVIDYALAGGCTVTPGAPVVGYGSDHLPVPLLTSA